MINSLLDTVTIETPIHMIDTNGIDFCYSSTSDQICDKASTMILNYF